jgi:hypothetical protein
LNKELLRKRARYTDCRMNTNAKALGQEHSWQVRQAKRPMWLEGAGVAEDETVLAQIMQNLVGLSEVLAFTLREESFEKGGRRSWEALWYLIRPSWGNPCSPKPLHPRALDQTQGEEERTPLPPPASGGQNGHFGSI